MTPPRALLLRTTPTPNRKRVPLVVVLLVILLALALAFVSALVSGWLLMLLLGALHGSVSHSVAHPGYVVCVGIAFLVSAVVSALRGSTLATVSK